MYFPDHFGALDYVFHYLFHIYKMMLIVLSNLYRFIKSNLDKNPVFFKYKHTYFNSRTKRKFHLFFSPPKFEERWEPKIQEKCSLDNFTFSHESFIPAFFSWMKYNLPKKRKKAHFFQFSNPGQTSYCEVFVKNLEKERSWVIFFIKITEDVFFFFWKWKSYSLPYKTFKIFVTFVLRFFVPIYEQ